MTSRPLCAVVAGIMAIAASGAALIEEKGLVTEKSAGWRFEASGAKGGADIPRSSTAATEPEGTDPTERPFTRIT